ncbi:glycosyltransferase family 61 protein [Rubellicoccus peritrichatus]|uniref:Glycosyltransferase family 61 protein n=1 Tax=Rubellicoccus peritrichatus TaxID=3080537 RepID=A0AAQ3L8B7_9BACT|nr:glycosyltransferase family 61 protein [Puniceicoccus sp. CR14]WOO40956.1 glycosyltransferase family 61 protein [Puniceicoccus sp. CR14]
MVEEIALETHPLKPYSGENIDEDTDTCYTLGEDEVRKTSKGTHLYKASALLITNSATVHGGIFSIKNKDSKFVTESITLNAKSNIDQHYKKALTFESQKTLEIDEPCILIANRAHENYYHWHINCLPAVTIATELQLPWRFIVPKLNNWQRDSLTILKIPPEKLIELDHHTSLHCQRLYTPTSVFNELRHVGIEILDSLRSLALESIGKVTPRRKVYLERSDSKARTLLNEEELANALQAVGFEIVTASNLSYREQVKLFLETEFLVTCHGAGLTNIAWLPPNASIYEIRPEFWNMKMYRHLAYIRELDYHSYVEEGEPVRGSRWTINDVPAMVYRITEQFATSNPSLWQKSSG